MSISNNKCENEMKDEFLLGQIIRYLEPTPLEARLMTLLVPSIETAQSQVEDLQRHMPLANMEELHPGFMDALKVVLKEERGGKPLSQCFGRMNALFPKHWTMADRARALGCSEEYFNRLSKRNGRNRLEVKMSTES
jgi:AraC-like DNA-binding protein